MPPQERMRGVVAVAFGIVLLGKFVAKFPKVEPAFGHPPRKKPRPPYLMSEYPVIGAGRERIPFVISAPRLLNVMLDFGARVLLYRLREATRARHLANPLQICLVASFGEPTPFAFAIHAGDALLGFRPFGSGFGCRVNHAATFRRLALARFRCSSQYFAVTRFRPQMAHFPAAIWRNCQRRWRETSLRCVNWS